MSSENETISIRPGEEFDLQKMEAYLRQRLVGLGTERLEVRQFPTGVSNLTYLLKIGAWEGVLRRQPLGPVPPKAHDMVREARLLEAISPVFPLAPRPYLICSDSSILGVPFYVMERRKGIALNDSFPSGIPPGEESGRHISSSLIDTLVQIHAIDWRAAGLGDFGYPENFLERQVRSWIKRYFQAQTDDIPESEPLARWLEEHIPISPTPTLIHNDFKLNNVLLSEQDLTKPVAVVDWEMATIGDPLFDLAITMSYWLRPEQPKAFQKALPTVTTMPGFMNHAEILELYAQKSGRDLSAMHFYLVFAYFKMAVIVQQIYARSKRGQTLDERFTSFGLLVPIILCYAAQLVEQGKI